MKKLKAIGLLILSGLLMASSFAPYDFIIGGMLGIVPLLIIEDQISKEDKWRKVRIFASAYLVFVVYNFVTIYWVRNAAWIGVIAPAIVNSAFFAMAIVAYSSIKSRLSPKAAYLSLVMLWVAWEYIELQDWDLSWPWLTYGFSLSNWVKLIQWYSYTGALGGTAWLLIVNLFVFFVYKSWKLKEDSFFIIKKGIQLGLVVFVPILISLLQYYTYEEKGFEQDVVVLQPNMNPYSDRFMDSKGNELKAMSAVAQVRRFTEIADKVMDEDVDFLLMHETALPQTESNLTLPYSASVGVLKRWRASKYPNLSILTGLAYREFKEGKIGEDVPATYKRSYDGRYYEYFNSSILINGENDTLPQYHKSMLVIGVERIPDYFVYFQKYLTDFDSDADANIYNPNNGKQAEREVFYGKGDSAIVAPVICYESLFGDYITEYVRKGANFLGVITNDAWWGNTAGYQQHWGFSRMRAIETRRSVARSANTGWSGFINQRGDELQKSTYLTQDVLRQKIQLNSEMSFYAQYGDIIGKLGVWFSIMALLNLLVKKVTAKGV
mgnify:FL=1|tara:strand:- start:768 stop:2420 length:1653 start_codon:yes stop_codon:yes gene_type:complete